MLEFHLPQIFGAYLKTYNLMPNLLESESICIAQLLQRTLGKRNPWWNVDEDVDRMAFVVISAQGKT